MRTELFTLCDYAKNDGGKLTIVDTFDVVIAEKLPWRAYFGFALKLRMENCDGGKELQLKIIEKDHPDNSLFCVNTVLSQIKEGGILATTGNLKGVVFEKEGDYEFKILLSEQEVYSFPFKVKLK